MLKTRFVSTDSKIEIGVDEAGRGCLAGPVVAAAVILDPAMDHPMMVGIQDSKKLTEKKRDEARAFIEKNALAYHVAFVGPERVDEINIRNATFEAMHEAIDHVTKHLETSQVRLLIDGNGFAPFKDIDYELVVGGDHLYMSIAAAGILAKTYRDEFINKICDEDPGLLKYGFRKNKCYGTKEHMEAIKSYGVTSHHRKSYAPCK